MIQMGFCDIYLIMSLIITWIIFLIWVSFLSHGFDKISFIKSECSRDLIKADDVIFALCECVGPCQTLFKDTVHTQVLSHTPTILPLLTSHVPELSPRPVLSYLSLFYSYNAASMIFISCYIISSLFIISTHYLPWAEEFSEVAWL